jgi:hypothetical protein
MPPLDPAANADRRLSIPLQSFEALPFAQQLPLLARVLREELNAGAFQRAAEREPPARDAADDRAQAPPVPAVDLENAPPADGNRPASALRRILNGISQTRAFKLSRSEAMSAPLSAANGPWLISLAFAALIGVELARILAAVTLGGPAQPAAPPAVRPIALRRPSLDVSNILAAHLFGAMAAEAGPRDPANAGPTTTKLALRGTIATGDPKHGVAIISDGGPAKVYQVGQDLGPATLHSVYLNRVVIERAGTLETLILLRSPPGGPGAGAGSTAARLTAAAPEPAR